MKRMSVSAVAALTVSCAIFVLMVSASVAQDLKYGDRQSKEEGGKRSSLSASVSSPGFAASSHSGESPFPTPTPTDSRFNVDTGYAGLDTTCTYRSQGSLKFKIAVKRYVGPTNGDGTLAELQKLKDNGVISEYAILRMPVKDIDFDTEPSPPYNPERDRVLFNGVTIGNLEGDGYLRGLNNRWIMNEFKVPINLVRFGQKGTNGNEPTPGENEIEILIDQANLESGEDVWCTAIDWASLNFNAMAPVIMITGNGKCGEFFEGKYDCNNQIIGTSFVKPFQDAGIPYDNSIDLLTPDFIPTNGGILLNEIPRVAREFGAKWIHLVAHSKGGLDTREFLARTPKNCVGDNCVGVLSLTTLATPHHGSVGADIISRSREANIIGLIISDQLRDTLIARFLQKRTNGRRHLTTWHLEDKFNPQNLPLLPDSFTVGSDTHPVKYFSFAADANINDSKENNDPLKPTIQDFETVGTGRPHWIMTPVYRFMGKTKTVTVERELKIFKRVVIETGAWEDNDFLVTESSAQLTQKFVYQPKQDANHATIISESIAPLVIPLIKSAQPR
ncbi:MAG TPA: hypothetical protein VFD48_01450 [Pyrinomonadaceae bacterium]|nr:hypothetical protein [Pyrinomonadaceae bacterium]